MYKVIYVVPGYAHKVHVFDEYERAKNVYEVVAGCKTNKGEVTRLVSVRQDGYEVELLSSDHGGTNE